MTSPSPVFEEVIPQRRKDAKEGKEIKRHRKRDLVYKKLCVFAPLRETLLISAGHYRFWPGWFVDHVRRIGCASVLKITFLKSSVSGGANSR